MLCVLHSSRDTTQRMIHSLRLDRSARPPICVCNSLRLCHVERSPLYHHFGRESSTVDDPAVVSISLVALFDKLHCSLDFWSQFAQLSRAFFCREELPKVVLQIHNTLTAVDAKSFPLVCAEFLIERRSDRGN